MAEINSIENKEHLITLRNRKVLAVNGVYEVVSFDESSVVMKTVCGELVIEGDGLQPDFLYELCFHIVAWLLLPQETDYLLLRHSCPAYPPPKYLLPFQSIVTILLPETV